MKKASGQDEAIRGDKEDEEARPQDDGEDHQVEPTRDSTTAISDQRDHENTVKVNEPEKTCQSEQNAKPDEAD